MNSPALYAFLVAAAAVAVAAAVQTLTGAGFGLTAAPPLLLVAPVLVPDTLLWLSLLVTGYTAWVDRTEADSRFVWRCVVAAAPGSVAGAMAVALLPAQGLTAGISVAVILAGCAGLAGARVSASPVNTTAAGFAAGALNWAAALPGPAVILVYRGEAAAVRATLSRVFLLMTVVTLTARYATGHAGGAGAGWVALLALAVLVGVVVARPFAARISGTLISRIALALSTAAGVALLVRSLP